MKIYFDMDGVLTDLYGMMSKEWSIPPEDIRGHSANTTIRYKQWVLEHPGPEEIFANIPPLHLEDVRSLMVNLHGMGHSLGILSALGVHSDFDHGSPIRSGKVRWLNTHFHDFLKAGILSDLNFVDSGVHKEGYACENSLLVDDTEWITSGFVAAGGKAVHYKSWAHLESIAEILKVTGYSEA